MNIHTIYKKFDEEIISKQRNTKKTLAWCDYLCCVDIMYMYPIHRSKCGAKRRFYGYDINKNSIFYIGQITSCYGVILWYFALCD